MDDQIKFVQCSTEEFEKLEVKDSNTLYFVLPEKVEKYVLKSSQSQS